MCLYCEEIEMRILPLCTDVHVYCKALVLEFSWYCIWFWYMWLYWNVLLYLSIVSNTKLHIEIPNIKFDMHMVVWLDCLFEVISLLQDVSCSLQTMYMYMYVHSWTLSRKIMLNGKFIKQDNQLFVYSKWFMAAGYTIKTWF